MHFRYLTDNFTSHCKKLNIYLFKSEQVIIALKCYWHDTEVVSELINNNQISTWAEMT